MAIIHDPKFYHDDGNIVLAAQDESENDVYFRLHKSILAKQSPVFADLFILPTPPNMELYDGVPLVRMAGDSASDLREFIELLYDPQRISNILAPRYESDFPMQLLGPSKIAKKYEVDWIVQMAASQLVKAWPSTVEGWLSIADDEKADVGYGDWPDSLADSTLRLRKLPKPSSSILLARECGATSILPFAFLDLLQCHPEPGGDYNSYNYIYDKDPERHLLSSEDLQRLLVARERIGAWFSQYQCPLLDSPSCNSGNPCQVAVYRTWLGLGKDVGRYGNVMQFSPQNNLYAVKMCPKCKHKLGDQVQELQKEFIELLDIFFQLNE